MSGVFNSATTAITCFKTIAIPAIFLVGVSACSRQQSVSFVNNTDGVVIISEVATSSGGIFYKDNIELNEGSKGNLVVSNENISFNAKSNEVLTAKILFEGVSTEVSCPLLIEQENKHCHYHAWILRTAPVSMKCVCNQRNTD